MPTSFSVTMCKCKCSSTTTRCVIVNMLSIFSCAACGAIGVGAERHACNGRCRHLADAAASTVPKTESFIAHLGEETALDHINELYVDSSSAESMAQWLMDSIRCAYGLAFNVIAS